MKIDRFEIANGKFQKNLVVWKPGPMIAESRHKIEFQKNLVVWKHGVIDNVQIYDRGFRRT